MSRKIRKLDSELPIHVVGRCNNREPFPVQLSDAWQILSDQLFLVAAEFKLKIISFVMMPNHYHLILRDPYCNLSTAMNYFMRESSRELCRRSNRINRIWGAPFHSSVIDSPLYYLHAYKYVYRNPVKARICAGVEAYPYSTLSGLIGQSRMILRVEEDETLFSDPTKTLEWLNEEYNLEDQESIARALKKKEFKFRADPHSRNPLFLEDWESVPAILRNYRK